MWDGKWMDNADDFVISTDAEWPESGVEAKEAGKLRLSTLRSLPKSMWSRWRRGQKATLLLLLCRSTTITTLLQQACFVISIVFMFKIYSVKIFWYSSTGLHHLCVIRKIRFCIRCTVMTTKLCK